MSPARSASSRRLPASGARAAGVIDAAATVDRRAERGGHRKYGESHPDHRRVRVASIVRPGLRFSESDKQIAFRWPLPTHRHGEPLMNASPRRCIRFDQVPAETEGQVAGRVPSLAPPMQPLAPHEPGHEA